MKSLKRTLCLVLALVMVLGLFGVASAASFTDDNAIQYKEAVDVMTGIGAINGMGDGTFAPKGTITRAQAAKLVTYAVLGQATAERLTGVTSSFTDVTVAGGYGWAIPSIEYLVREGIINGMGDGTFNPNGEISGIATLKMLLCALGYGKKGEYTGTGWDLQVVLDANKVGLTKGRTSTASAENSATREEVALYCFNAIQTDLVEYISTLDIYATSSSSLGNKLGTIMTNVYGAGNGNLTKTPYYDVLDDKGVKVSDGGKDAFGAPANVWTYKSKTIGAYPVGDVVTYTSKQTLAKVTADLRGYKYESNLKATENGKTGGTAITAGSEASVIASLTGNGTVVKVFAENNVIGDVVVIKTDVAHVSGVDAVRKTVTLAIDTDANTGAAAKVSNKTITQDDDLYSAVAGVAVDDIVLVTLAGDTTGAAYKIASITVPTQVTGKVTTVNTATNTVYLDGTRSYPKAATATAAVAQIAVDATKDATLWIDSYGNIVNSKTTTTAESKFVYVLDAYSTIDGNRVKDTAKVVWPNGTIEEIAIDTAASGIHTAGPKLYKVTAKSGEGVYTITATMAGSGTDYDTASSAAEAPIGNYVKLTATGKINASDLALTAYTQTAAANFESSLATDFFNNYYSSNVKFIYIDKTARTATVLNGVQPVGSIKDDAYAIIERDMSTGVERKAVAAVILEGVDPATASTSELVYLPITGKLKSNEPSTADDATPKAFRIAETTLTNTTTNKPTKVPVYNAYVNGEFQATGLPSATEEGHTTTNSIPYNAVGFYTRSAVSNVPGSYNLSAYTKTTGATAVKVMQTLTAGYGTALTFGGSLTLQTAGAKFVDVRAADEQTKTPISLDAKSIAAALGDYTINVSVVYNADTGVASLVYINSVAAKAPAPTEHNVTVSTSAVTVPSGGKYSVAVDKNKAAKDATVKITITLTDAQSVSSGKDTFTITITDNISITGTKEINLSGATAGTTKTELQFTMPDKDVSISVSGSHT